MNALVDRHCAPCDGATEPLTEAEVSQHMATLSQHWKADGAAAIKGEFKFGNYYETQAFINAVAYIAHREDHHPDITFGYNSATVSLTTHAIGGLSDNDFISAAKIDRLLA